MAAITHPDGALMPHPALFKGEGSKKMELKSSPLERILNRLLFFGVHEGCAV
jgi:hypothetical protein